MGKVIPPIKDAPATGDIIDFVGGDVPKLELEPMRLYKQILDSRNPKFVIVPQLSEEPEGNITAANPIWVVTDHKVFFDRGGRKIQICCVFNTQTAQTGWVSHNQLIKLS